VETHLGLVHAVANRYRNLGLPVEDLAQEGAIGLLEAIDRFDPEQGPFATYAFWRIREAVTHALTDQAHLVRLPKHIVERRRAIAGAAARLANQGHPSTPSELAAETGLTEVAVSEALTVPVSPASLDQPGPDGTPLSGIVADATAADPEAATLATVSRSTVAEAVSHLSPRKQLVITRHFGLSGDSQTLADVASELHLSPQRTRAIEQDALYELAADLDGNF
jgi:RNA polymerase sigma factor (sigma-70 family)